MTPKRPATLEKPNTPNAVKTLRSTYRRKLALPKIADLVAELGAESDRATVILAASLLDDLLANAIAMKMPWDILVNDMQEIFDYEGPLGSLSSRLRVGNLFGAIDNETYAQLQIVRELRNACAHSKHRIGFGDQELHNVALRLFGNGFIAPEFAEKEMKRAFVLEVCFLALVLSHGREEAMRLSREQMKMAARHASRGTLKPP